MRNFYLTLFSCLALGAQAQNVSTSVTMKNVLMEDFTGFKCGNCPDGHAYVNKLVLGHPKRIFPIAVHAGSYAKPNAADQPDFLTNEGTTINDFFGINSYPSGMTNRSDMGTAGIVQSRSYWIPSSRTLCSETAPVNVWVCSSYDKDTRVISTDVELYYTSDISEKSSALCVSLLQSRILGPQAGDDKGDEYVHNHVLRAMFTPVWGDTIATSNKGTLVSKHYEYTLPEVIGNIDTDPQHLDIVAYVIDPAKAVMNVNGCEVQCPGMTLPTTATLEEYKILPVRNNAFPYLECYLCNEGTDTLKSAEFKLTIDNDDCYSCTWNAGDGDGYAPIPGKQRGYVRVPVEWPASVIASGCDYKLQLTGLNGNAYTGETIKGAFGAMLKVTSDMSVVIKTDKYADDNSFRLLDDKGNTIAEYGPYEEGSAIEHTETIHFPEYGTYCFEITDSWGNGMLSPRGYVKWYDSNNNLVASNNDIENWGYRVFFNYEAPSAITEVHNSLPNGEGSGETYNLAGLRVNNNAKGIVIQNKKKIIK